MTETTALQPGDIVVLKSGSPKMTVVRLTDNIATVVFNQYGTINFETRTFDQVVLKKLA